MTGTVARDALAPALAPALAAALESALRSVGTPERAAAEQAYLKSDLEFFGASVPAVRAAVRQRLRAVGPLTHDDVVATVEALWARPVHECRAAAVELLEMTVDRLGPDDVPLLERLLRESRTWALVDNIAASVVGPLAERHPAELAPTLDRWAFDEDFWLRRSALLALLLALRRGDGDWERFCRYADAMLDEREFFIRKAIGWVLRDTARRRPSMVVDWLEPRVQRASSVTVREAVRPLPPRTREQLLRRRAAAGVVPARQPARTARGPARGRKPAADSAATARTAPERSATGPLRAR